MSIMFFMDESGQDRKESPYEVLAGVAIDDNSLWNLICDIHDLELKTFGTRYSIGKNELKARKILSRKTFRKAKQMPPITDLELRARSAKKCLLDGANAGKVEITALAQAKIDYVKQVLLLCNKYRCKLFAAIVKDYDKLDEMEHLLRRDYVYLFERFYYYLQSKNDETGIMVFDELEKTKSHLLIDNITSYYKKSEKGKIRSNLLIPEPFFVHSDLTTGVQLADLVAYIVSWGYRYGELGEDRREELDEYVELLRYMRYRDLISYENGEDREYWSIFYI